MKLFFVICLLFFAPFFAFSEPGEVSLLELERVDLSLPKRVHIRGFLYRTEKGEWVLAAEPNLKSCCIGKKSQVQVIGDFPNSFKTAVTLEGDLIANQGSEIPYRLENAFVLIDRTNRWIPFAGLAFLAIFGALFWWKPGKNKTYPKLS